MDSDLNLRAMLYGDINRLCFVPRYATTYLIRSENVAEHTALVSLYCICIARWVSKNTDKKVDLEKLLLSAAVHDLEEVRSGDLNRTFKHHDTELRARLNDVAGELLGETIRELFPNDEGFSSSMLGAWRNAKDLSVEGRILAFVDFLQAVSFLGREYTLGNKEVARPPVSLPYHFNVFENESYDFLRPLVRETQVLINEIFA